MDNEQKYYKELTKQEKKLLRIEFNRLINWQAQVRIYYFIALPPLLLASTMNIIDLINNFLDSILALRILIFLIYIFIIIVYSLALIKINKLNKKFIAWLEHEKNLLYKRVK